VSESDPKTSFDLHQGLVTALACWLASVLAFAFHLDDPWWATISAWIVAHPERHALLEKAANRILGTVVGCIASFWLALWIEGRPSLQTVAMFALGSIGVYNRFRSSRSYAWTIGAITGLMIVATSLETPGQIFHIAVYRSCEVICGVVAATIVELLLYRQNSPVDSATAPTKPAAKPFVPPVDRPTALRLATIGGVSMMLIPILWSRLYLPSLTQIAVSSFVVLDRDAASTHFRGLLRILGCFAGVAFALLALRLEPDSFVLWTIILIAGIFLFALLHHSNSRWSYVGTQGGIAFIISLVSGLGPPDSIVPAANRISGMLCGVGILICVSFVFGHPGSSRWPLQRQSRATASPLTTDTDTAN
jgi:uncharacterized membrane protein YccC